MVLRGDDIREAIRAKELFIQPFDEKRLTPNGYILTVERVSVPKVHWTVREGYAAVGKMTRFLVRTAERVALGPDLTATLTLAPELSEKGVIASLPRLDAGYDAKVNVSAFNSSVRTIDVSNGEPVVEMVIERISGKAEAKDGADKAAGTGATGPAPGPAQRTSTPVSPLKGLCLDPRDGGHPCLVHSCTICCHDTEMPLTIEDRKRLEAMGHTDFWIEHDGWLTLRNIDGACIFLKELRCTVYKQRPVGCTFYPAVHSMDEDRAIPDTDCPYSSEFAITSTLDKDLKNLVDTVQRERKQRKLRRGF